VPRGNGLPARSNANLFYNRRAATPPSNVFVWSSLFLRFYWEFTAVTATRESLLICIPPNQVPNADKFPNIFAATANPL